MGWMIVIFVLVALGAVVAVVAELARRRGFSPIALRGCAGREWLRRFPGASKSDVRQFLEIVLHGFALRQKHLLKFRPDDRVMDIYRAINPPDWTLADHGELEAFAELLEERYGIALESIWRDDITLGEIFGLTKRA